MNETEIIIKCAKCGIDLDLEKEGGVIVQVIKKIDDEVVQNTHISCLGCYQNKMKLEEGLISMAEFKKRLQSELDRGNNPKEVYLHPRDADSLLMQDARSWCRDILYWCRVIPDEKIPPGRTVFK